MHFRQVGRPDLQRLPISQKKSNESHFDRGGYIGPKMNKECLLQSMAIVNGPHILQKK